MAPLHWHVLTEVAAASKAQAQGDWKDGGDVVASFCSKSVSLELFAGIFLQDAAGVW